MALDAPTDGPLGDSALLVDDGETRLLNMNDSRPTDPDKLLTFGPLDLLFLQFSGAIWYPMVYEFPPKAKITLAHKKRVVQLARAQRYIEILAPTFVVPSAGPPCFLDDDLFEQNDLHARPGQHLPRPDRLPRPPRRGRDPRRPPHAPRLDRRARRGPRSTSSIRCRTTRSDRHLRRPRAVPPEYQARMRPRLDAEHERWRGDPDAEPLDLLAELKAWFEPLMGFGEQICSGIGAQVLLDLGSEGIVLDFVDQKVRRWDGREATRYVFRIARPHVELLVREHEVDWVNSLFLSMRFSAARKGPYNDYLYTWFKCLDLERIQYAEGFYAEKAKSRGLVRHRRLGGPASLPAHEGRPHPLRLDRAAAC